MNKKNINKCCKVLYNVDFTNYNSYRLKINAFCVAYPENVEELKKIIIFSRENNIKYKVVGECSNLIFEKDYDGILIKLDKFNNLKIEGKFVTVGAGYKLSKLSLKTAHASLTGLEFASGIPGSVGSAIYNNSGAYKSDMGYVTESVLVLTPFLEIKRMYNKELNYHYRTSFLKNNPGYICIEANIKLKKGNEKESLELIEDRKKRRIESQPLEYPSAGSVFRNPKDMFVGEMIEKIGYKGFKIGGAMVSLKHANFIINNGNAKGEDIIKLIEEIKKQIKEKYNVDLVLEQEIVR